MNQPKPNRGRRTPEERAFDELYKAAWRENREMDAAAQVAERGRLEQQLDSERAGKGYEADLARDAERDSFRQLSEDLQDYVFGRNTPGARRARERFEQVKAAKHQAVVASDPLNITGHTRQTRVSRDVRRKQAKKKSQRFVHFFAPDGQRVTVDLKANPLIAVYRNGVIEAPQFAAAGRFQDDVDIAAYAGMQSRGFEPGVDGGRMAQINLAAIDAQTRLRKLRGTSRERGVLGEELYELVTAVLLDRIPMAEICKAGGPHHRTLGDKLRDALDRMSQFYGYQGDVGPSVTMRAIMRARERRTTSRNDEMATKNKPDRNHPFR